MFICTNTDDHYNTRNESIYLGLLFMLCNEIYRIKYEVFFLDRVGSVLVSFAIIVVSMISSNIRVRLEIPRMINFRVYMEWIHFAFLIWIPYHIFFLHMWSFPENHVVHLTIRNVYMVFIMTFNTSVVAIFIVVCLYVIWAIGWILQSIWNFLAVDTPKKIKNS